MLYNHKMEEEKKEMPLQWRTFSAQSPLSNVLYLGGKHLLQEAMDELSYWYADWKIFGDYAAEDNYHCLQQNHSEHLQSRFFFF